MEDKKIKITVLSFGLAAEILQKRAFSLETSAENLGDLRKELSLAFPELSRLKNLSFAVNKQYQNDDFAINNQDEIALIPPVSGG